MSKELDEILQLIRDSVEFSLDADIDKEVDILSTNIQALIDREVASARVDGCPCFITEPCSSQCTCANPIMSGGCEMCCKYGNYGQRQASADRLKQLKEKL